MQALDGIDNSMNDDFAGGLRCVVSGMWHAVHGLRLCATFTPHPLHAPCSLPAVAAAINPHRRIRCVLPAALQKLRRRQAIGLMARSTLWGRDQAG